MLGEVIVDLEGQTTFEIEERARSLARARRGGDITAGEELRALIADQSLTVLRALIKAFSTYFQLINLAEDAQRVRVLRRRELAGDLGESLEDAIGRLAVARPDEAGRRQVLDSLAARLVLTAHPTEAKRSVVLAKLRAIARALADLRISELLPRERRKLEHGIRSAIVSLWQTATARVERPPVLDEVYHALYFLTQTTIEVVPEIETTLEQLAADRLGIKDWRGSGVVRYGTWAGGDRDGNPAVTPRTTISALEAARQEAQKFYLQQVDRLSEQLSQASSEVAVSEELMRSLAGDARGDGRLAATLESRYAGEPYRQKLGFIAARLAAGAYRSGAELERDLLLMRRSLEANGAAIVANAGLDRLLRQVASFGLELAALEVRQEAGRHHQAIDELLAASGRPGYLDLAGDAREQLLAELADSPRLKPVLDLSPSAEDTWMTFRAIAEAHQKFGAGSIDAYVISLCRGASDVMAVLALAEMANVAGDLDIVPLFETSADLEAAPAVLDRLFSHASYRRHLAARGERQQVMIGYSDSNKESGYLAAHWQLYRAQRAIADTCAANDVGLVLFHGRGGTTARGGGPANRAILAQPGGTVRGRLKMTEQGEVIAERYANHEIAYRHLSQVVNALLRASLKERHPLAEALVTAMTVATTVARDSYRRLIDGPGFVDYFQGATPLAEVSRLALGSRPARRHGRVTVDGLRAIPWVFSWMQCRANIPGWYGLGSGLEAAAVSSLGDLREAYETWDFFRAVIDNAEMALAKTDLRIAALYTELVPDAALRKQTFATISSEYERTVALVLQTTGQPLLLGGSPELRLSIERRNPYVDPLNHLQVELLRRLRSTPEDSAEHAGLLAAVFQTINGIAAGMKNTG